ncbi:hypothetical protein Y032_0048g1600 [Ancylostoma ceylanicum]|uniref:SCP domain-containing protein n=2 Tax=Ancylostoma ceylanicum TaxID=53326 RepID=A0A016U9W1_9BILA|nr:hypothetical protein Y032_0048g1600 [Ancylostoma ceylanicum]
MHRFSPGKKCNSTTTIKDILKKWWDEVKGIDLKASQAYVAGLEHFAPMAAAEAKGFACSTKICSSSESDLLCVYDKLYGFLQNGWRSKRNLCRSSRLNINDNIYTKGDTADKICDTCNQNKLCTNSLCQYDYTLADERPERACKDDKLTNDLEAVVVNMHNYYRRLSATGWAEDKKDGYAPTAKQLKALEYDCAGLGAQSLAKAANCPEKAPDADAGASLNHFYVREYETPKAELFEKAIRKWAEEVKEVGVGKENTYTEGKGFDSYAHMLFQDATKVGCAVEICKNFGASVVICQYNASCGEGTLKSHSSDLFIDGNSFRVPQDDDPIYTVGKPCGGCTTCSKLGGLCA